MSAATFKVYDYDQDREVELPAHFEICDRCRGTGVHDHPAFSNGITASEFAEMEYDDPDFRRDYMRGRYDVRCSECGGLRVVPVVEEDRLNAYERALLESHREGLREAAAERRMRERGIQF